MAPPISICIAACNEQAKIQPALESARACPWCSELLVFDSGSTDRTVEIARSIADRVEFHEWTTYADSKRRMTEAAANDWVFILDADEQITPELAGEIAGLTDESFDRHPLMTMPRRNYLLGRHVRAWDPDRQNRLFHRGRVDWPDRAVHDERVLREGTALALHHPLLHNPMVDDFRDYFDGPRYARRVEALAGELYQAGRRAGWFDLAFRPVAAFLKFYVAKGGFLQGSFGLVIAQKAAVSVQLKYARLWHMQRAGRNIADPLTPDPQKESDHGTPAV